MTSEVNFKLDEIYDKLEPNESNHIIFRKNGKWESEINDLVTEEDVDILRSFHKKDKKTSEICQKIELLYIKLVAFSESITKFVNSVEASVIIALSNYICAKSQRVN